MRIYGNRYRKGDDVSTNRMAFWGVIPAPVRGDQTLTDKAKLLYADLSALADEKGYCWACNEYLAQLYKCGERTISRCIAQLAELGFIRIETVPIKGGRKSTERRIFLGVFGTGKSDLAGVDKIGEVANFGEAGVDKNGEATPYCNSYGITGMNKRNDNNPHTPKGGMGRSVPKWKPDRFEKFWEYYRKNVRDENRSGAVKAWDKLKPDDDLIAEIGRALVKLGRTEAWIRGIGKPYASTFLNGRKWEDAHEVCIESDKTGGWAEDPEVI